MLEGLYGAGAHVAQMLRFDADTMKKMIQVDFLRFILFLGNSDGQITKEEAGFIREYFEWNLTIQQWYTFISENNFNIVSAEVPATFQFFIEVDNYEYNQDRDIDSVCETYIQIFKAIGESFIGIDRNVDSDEVSALNEFINKMQSFYEENTIRTNINKPKPIDKELAEKLGDIELSNQEKLEQEQSANVENTKYFSVKFLDKIYDIPEDVIIFYNCREFVSEGLIKLLDEASSLMKKYSRMGSERATRGLSNDVKHIQQVMMSVVKDVHNDLLKREIYDVDENELYERITSIKQVESMATDVAFNILCAAKEVQRDNQTMRNNAYRSAVSNISGSGVRIFTNSFTSLLVHSAIENSVLKSQAKKADREYEQALKSINASSEDRFERIYSDGLFKQFLPALPEIFTTFNDELLKNYLLELVQHNQFNIDNIEQYSENKSSTMLENIKHAGDKKKLLIQAFEICPFNFNVYKKALELGFFDFKTFKDAKKIFGSKITGSLIEEEITKYISDIDKMKDYISLLAYYKDENEQKIWSQYYQNEINMIRDNYRKISILCTDSVELDEWIKIQINPDMDKIVKTTEKEVKKCLESWFLTNMNNKRFDKLSSIGLISVEDIRLQNSVKTTLEEVNEEYIEKILLMIIDYITEAGKRKIVYEEAYNKFNLELKKRNAVIAEKETELNQQGIFAFTKKKELKIELEKLQNELREFKKTEPVDLKKAYYNMYA